MLRPLIIICLLAPVLSFAQAQGVSQEEKNNTLLQRYTAMKSKAETYQDYKVIKEYVMDGEWKIMIDSLKEQKLLVVKRQDTISKLETDLRAIQNTLAQEHEAAAQIVYDSSHISVLGIHFKKGAFIVLMATLFSLLVFIGSGFITKMKLLQATAKEKIVVADLITKELEEFKQKAMEKQIKLARELQNERNKLADLKQSLAH